MLTLYFYTTNVLIYHNCTLYFLYCAKNRLLGFFVIFVNIKTLNNLIFPENFKKYKFKMSTYKYNKNLKNKINK